MHRQKTKFSRRVNRVFTHRANGVAKALETRGIRATYELHDRVLSNRSSRKSFAEQPPQLDETQQRIVSEVEAEGFSTLPFTELFPDGASGRTSRPSATASCRRRRPTSPPAATRCACARARSSSCACTATASRSTATTPGSAPSARAACSTSRTRTCACGRSSSTSTSGTRCRRSATAERVSSQRWHRDYNDKHLLKAFLYLVDVNEEMGPFQYVPGSQPGGPYGDEWGWKPLGQNYPTEEELESRIPASAIHTFTAPKGTLIFCNTAGFHRGGFSTTDPRVLATVTYSSPASLASLTERSFDYRGSLDELDAPTRFALS